MSHYILDHPYCDQIARDVKDEPFEGSAQCGHCKKWYHGEYYCNTYIQKGLYTLESGYGSLYDTSHFKIENKEYIFRLISADKHEEVKREYTENDRALWWDDLKNHMKNHPPPYLEDFNICDMCILQMCDTGILSKMEDPQEKAIKEYEEEEAKKLGLTVEEYYDKIKKDQEEAEKRDADEAERLGISVHDLLMKKMIEGDFWCPPNPATE